MMAWVVFPYKLDLCDKEECQDLVDAGKAFRVTISDGNDRHGDGLNTTPTAYLFKTKPDRCFKGMRRAELTKLGDGAFFRVDKYLN